MEEDKIQKLHDSLSKLRRGKGLGISSHYNFGGGNSVDNGHGVNIKENGNGELYREDGLPVNALYSNFLKQGSYSKTDSALKYGDGRKIKRNFDDCTSGGEEGSDGDSTKAAKKRKKAEKKALKKAEKLEAKKKVIFLLLLAFNNSKPWLDNRNTNINHLVYKLIENQMHYSFLFKIILLLLLRRKSRKRKGLNLRQRRRKSSRQRKRRKLKKKNRNPKTVLRLRLSNQQTNRILK